MVLHTEVFYRNDVEFRFNLTNALPRLLLIPIKGQKVSVSDFPKVKLMLI